MSEQRQGVDEFLLGLIRAAGLEQVFAEFPDDVLAAVRGAMQERDKLHGSEAAAPRRTPTG
jgi:hypothetical protein